MSKKFHEFSEEEMITLVNQVPIYIANWMRELGIRQFTDINEQNDIYESVKKVILEHWEKARALHGDGEE